MITKNHLMAEETPNNDYFYDKNYNLHISGLLMKTRNAQYSHVMEAMCCKVNFSFQLS